MNFWEILDYFGKKNNKGLGKLKFCIIIFIIYDELVLPLIFLMKKAIKKAKTTKIIEFCGQGVRNCRK